MEITITKKRNIIYGTISHLRFFWFNIFKRAKYIFSYVMRRKILFQNDTYHHYWFPSYKKCLVKWYQTTDVMGNRYWKYFLYQKIITNIYSKWKWTLIKVYIDVRICISPCLGLSYDVLINASWMLLSCSFSTFSLLVSDAKEALIYRRLNTAFYTTTVNTMSCKMLGNSLIVR